MANTTIPATSSELAARVDAGWRPFREAVRGLGRARLDERTPAGWSYHDLIAHVAAWEELTARRLRTLHESGDRTEPEAAADAFNAHVVATHRLVGAEALLDELDTAHRSLLAALEGLSDDEVAAEVQETPWGPASWVVAIVAGNTYGHYAEHAAELEAA